MATHSSILAWRIPWTEELGGLQSTGRRVGHDWATSLSLSPWKETYDQPRQHIKKQRHYFARKVHLVKAMVFPVVMYGCESWTIKKAECRRIDVFELWCWRRLLRVPWIARRSNQCILKEMSPEFHWKDWCWSWNSSALATSCKKLTHLKRPWCWERLKMGGEGMTEDEMVGWHLWLNGHEFE